VKASATCTICPKGSACPHPSVEAAIACPAGFYTAETGYTSCTGCPAGQICAGGIADPVDCAVGEYALGYASTCETCPAGYYCSVGSAPKICASGTSSIAGESECTECPDDSGCPNVSDKTTTPCGSGFYQLGTSSAPICEKCPIGHFCDDADKAPVPCSAGTYADDYGMTACTACTTNVCPFTDAVGYDCPAGYTANMEKTGCFAASATGSCAPGQYAYPNTAPCVACPEGFACPMASSPPRLCPKGFYSAASATTCI